MRAQALAGSDSKKDTSPLVRDLTDDDLLDRRLRAEYDKLLQEPVPDRFLDLLKQYERKRASPREDDGHHGDKNSS